MTPRCISCGLWHAIKVETGAGDLWRRWHGAVASSPPPPPAPTTSLPLSLSLSLSLLPFDVLLNEATPISSWDRVRLPLHTFRRRRGRKNSPCVMYSRGVEWSWSTTERYLVGSVCADVLVPNLCSRALRQQWLLGEGRAAFQEKIQEMMGTDNRRASGCKISLV